MAVQFEAGLTIADDLFSSRRRCDDLGAKLFQCGAPNRLQARQPAIGRAAAARRAGFQLVLRLEVAAPPLTRQPAGVQQAELPAAPQRQQRCQRGVQAETRSGALERQQPLRPLAMIA